MKTYRIAIPALSSAAFLTLLSCNTEDPSAAGETQRNLAAALAKNSSLEKEVASLTELLQQAQQSVAEAESMKMPTRAEIEKSLAIEGTKLQQVARDLHPDSKVEGFGTFDLNITEATGIYQSFVGGGNKMVDILHRLADGTFVEHCNCIISRP